MSDTQQRKLAAIMFTDLVGYSLLTQKDENLAMEVLDEHFELLRSVFPQFGGVEVKTIGDSFLVEFASVLEAVRAGRNIQKAIDLHNDTATPDRRFLLRIGIHLGDVIHRDEDVFGDGVNIASRIERFAEPGGICVSEDVYNQLRRQEEFEFVPLGTKRLKNIEIPLSLYKLLSEGERVPIQFIRQTIGLGPLQTNLLVGGMTVAAVVVFGLSLYWAPGGTLAASGEVGQQAAAIPTSAPPASRPSRPSRPRESRRPARRRVAYLVLKGHHDIEEGRLYLFAGGDLLRSIKLRRAKDQAGEFETRIPVLPGSHDLEIRVRSKKPAFDTSRVVVAAFERNQTRTLYVELIKKGGFLGVRSSRELRIRWLE